MVKAVFVVAAGVVLGFVGGWFFAIWLVPLPQGSVEQRFSAGMQASIIAGVIGGTIGAVLAIAFLLLRRK